MQIPPLPEDEEARLNALLNLNILETPLEESFERITRITKSLFSVPMAAISLVDEQRQWFKSAQGLDVYETDRDISFCGHAILQDEVFNVPDALADPRFADNPLVVGTPYIRFYAGYPIRAKNGKKVGSLCVMDTHPRNFSDDELSRLKDMTMLVEIELENHVVSYAQTKLIAELDEARRASLIDPLTRLWNREGILRILNHQMAYSIEKKQLFGLAIADIDNFKQVNDKYGHNTGDAILREVAKRFIESCRTEDAVGRWGGGGRICHDYQRAYEKRY